MEKLGQKKYAVIFSTVVSAAISAVMFLSDKRVFTFPEAGADSFVSAITDYSICKVLAFLVLSALIYGIILLAFVRDETAFRLRAVIKCALWYLPVILIVLAIKLPEGFLTNDEYSIYADATGLVHDTWFNYMTVYYYIVSLMLIPIRYAPIITKVVIEFFAVGYTVYRAQEYFGKKAGSAVYILFLIYPVIAYTTSAHRLPIYFLLYLVLFVKIIFDRAEKRQITRSGIAFLLVLGAILTQWRTEGIYLLVLVPVLMFVAYPDLRNKKTALCVIVSCVLIQYVLSVPQNGALSADIGGAANDRMKPFYAYTITNMFRNGLDRTANAEDIKAVDAYLSIDAIDAINEHYEDINYEDVLILYQEGFVGVRPDATYSEYYEFTEAVKRIFINNPGVFARTRWGAFRYAALPYSISFSGFGIRNLAAFAISVVKTVSYDLFIPVIFAILCFVYCVVRRRWFGFFIFAGILAHWFIVFVLAPASYFKYYFPVYIMSYFFAIVFIAAALCKIEGRKADTLI